jgi:uncharacterized protein YecT (DUF1311 family)
VIALALLLAAACPGTTTVEMVDCMAAETKTWDGRLNAAYRAAMARAATAQKPALRDAQRLWIRYRDANCRAYGLGEGTIRQIAAAACQRDMTAARARELEKRGADR